MACLTESGFFVKMVLTDCSATGTTFPGKSCTKLPSAQSARAGDELGRDFDIMMNIPRDHSVIAQRQIGQRMVSFVRIHDSGFGWAVVKFPESCGIVDLSKGGRSPGLSGAKLDPTG